MISGKNRKEYSFDHWIIVHHKAVSLYDDAVKHNAVQRNCISSVQNYNEIFHPNIWIADDLFYIIKMYKQFQITLRKLKQIVYHTQVDIYNKYMCISFRNITKTHLNLLRKMIIEKYTNMSLSDYDVTSCKISDVRPKDNKIKICLKVNLIPPQKISVLNPVEDYKKNINKFTKENEQKKLQQKKLQKEKRKKKNNIQRIKKEISLKQSRIKTTKIAAETEESNYNDVEIEEIKKEEVIHIEGTEINTNINENICAETINVIKEINSEKEDVIRIEGTENICAETINVIKEINSEKLKDTDIQIPIYIKNNSKRLNRKQSKALKRKQKMEIMCTIIEEPQENLEDPTIMNIKQKSQEISEDPIIRDILQEIPEEPQNNLEGSVIRDILQEPQENSEEISEESQDNSEGFVIRDILQEPQENSVIGYVLQDLQEIPEELQEDYTLRDIPQEPQEISEELQEDSVIKYIPQEPQEISEEQQEDSVIKYIPRESKENSSENFVIRNIPQENSEDLTTRDIPRKTQEILRDPTIRNIYEIQKDGCMNHEKIETPRVLKNMNKSIISENCNYNVPRGDFLAYDFLKKLLNIDYQCDPSNDHQLYQVLKKKYNIDEIMKIQSKTQLMCDISRSIVEAYCLCQMMGVMNY